MPQIAEVVIFDSQKWVYINFNVTYDGDMFAYEQVLIEFAKFDYAGVVDALISHKYPNDKMQAVINNYLLDPEDAYAIDEFNKMQAWRKEAKEIAKQVMEYELH